jgi:hypothetical protein
MKCREALELVDVQLPDDEILDFNIMYVNYFFDENFPLYNKPKKHFRALMNQIIELTDLDKRHPPRVPVENYYYRHFKGHNGSSPNYLK